MAILNPRVSGSTFHKIPNACSLGNLQPKRVFEVRYLVQDFLAILAVKLNHPLLHTEITFLNSLIASSSSSSSSSELTDLNRSSTCTHSFSSIVPLIFLCSSFQCIDAANSRRNCSKKWACIWWSVSSFQKSPFSQHENVKKFRCFSATPNWKYTFFMSSKNAIVFFLNVRNTPINSFAKSGLVWNSFFKHLPLYSTLQSNTSYTLILLGLLGW